MTRTMKRYVINPRRHEPSQHDGLAYLADSAAQSPLAMSGRRTDWDVLLQMAETGVAVFENGTPTFINPAFQKIFGLGGVAEATAARLQRRMMPSDDEQDLVMLLHEGKPARFEFCADLSKKWYSLQLTPHPDRRSVMLMHCTDISAFRRRDELLSFATKMEAMGQLAGGVAHDVNNVLAIIEGYARLIQRGMERDMPINDHLDKIVQAVRRGAGITKQLLSFGRTKTMPEGHTNLRMFLTEQRDLLIPLLDARIKLEISLPDEDLFAAIHEDMLAQIILNAVTNARDAMEETHGGTITITASATPDRVNIAVRDTGCGMDEITRKRALEPFFTTKAFGKGTGLGLSQIYGLLQQVHGSLGLHSQPNLGTTLVIKLPRCPDEARDIAVSRPHKHMAGQTVLIVDDEADLVAVMEDTLCSMGFEVITAGSGGEALALQESHDGPIHWLLSDVIMKDMSGPRLRDLVCAARPETQAIYMSGYPASGDMARIQLPKDASYIAKPVDPLALLEIMNGLHGDSLSLLAGAQHP